MALLLSLPSAAALVRLDPIRASAHARIERLNHFIARSEMICDDELCIPAYDALEHEEDDDLPPRFKVLVAKAKRWGTKRLLSLVGDAQDDDVLQNDQALRAACTEVALNAACEQGTLASSEVSESWEEMAPSYVWNEDNNVIGEVPIPPAFRDDEALVDPAQLPFVFSFKGHSRHATLSSSSSTDDLFSLAAFFHDLGDEHFSLIRDGVAVSRGIPLEETDLIYASERRLVVVD